MDKEIKTKIEAWLINSEKTISYEQKEIEQKWIKESEDPIFQNMQQNMGIGLLHPGYIETNEDQDKIQEFIKITNFLQAFIKNYALKNNLKVEELKLEFINYGKTELVYVLTEPNNKRITLLVKQPAVEFGKVKQESIYLAELKNIDDNVIAPTEYFTLDNQELYVTPYINQARCVASYNSWGIYIPEPYYRFENFSKEQEKIVNTCMIAKLVSLYNHKTNEGIISCKLGGGDFMLPKNWETKNPTIENTLNNLYLIAAREKLLCSFENYLNIIRNEFSKRTIDEDQENLIINLRGRVPMRKEDIESGIELGKQLIKERAQKKYKR